MRFLITKVQEALKHRNLHVCPHPGCGSSPLILCFDGTALGFQKSKCSCTSLEPPNANDPVVVGSTFASRLCIEDAGARRTISVFTSRNSSYRDSDRAPKQIPEEFKKKVDKAKVANEKASCTVS